MKNASPNPYNAEVGGKGRFSVTDKLGRKFVSEVKPETLRVTVIREANTNGLWCWQSNNDPGVAAYFDHSLTKLLTFLQAGSIVSFDFLKEETKS